jgi:hypothetical protein
MAGLTSVPVNQPNMGMGALAGPNTGFKRKFRWTLSISWQGTPLPAYMVKIASRPNLSIEETEINFLNGKMWIPGKASWENITVTFYDLFGENSTSLLYSWLASIYNFLPNGKVDYSQTSVRGDGLSTNNGVGGWAGNGTLQLYDGCGTALEAWYFQDLWPQAINFGELDYSSSEEVTIEVTMRYSQVSFTSFCPKIQPIAGCLGC